jgi:hypothetical protein
LAALKKNPAKGAAGPRWPRYAEDGKRAAEACSWSRQTAGRFWFFDLSVPIPGSDLSAAPAIWY